MANVTYEVWDFETRNMIGAYDTEEEALELVRGMIRTYGPEAVRQWGLGRDRRGRLTSLAEGEALIERACAREVMRSMPPANT